MQRLMRSLRGPHTNTRNCGGGLVPMLVQSGAENRKETQSEKANCKRTNLVNGHKKNDAH